MTERYCIRHISDLDGRQRRDGHALCCAWCVWDRRTSGPASWHVYAKTAGQAARELNRGET